MLELKCSKMTMFKTALTGLLENGFFFSSSSKLFKIYFHTNRKDELNTNIIYILQEMAIEHYSLKRTKASPSGPLCTRRSQSHWPRWRFLKTSEVAASIWPAGSPASDRTGPAPPGEGEGALRSITHTLDKERKKNTAQQWENHFCWSNPCSAMDSPQ